MFTANTYPLQDNQFVDTYGFFTLRNESTFEYHVPKNTKYGKLGRHSGYRVKLSLIGQMRYGVIIQIDETHLKTTKSIKKLDFNKFNEVYKKFNEYDTWVSEKRKEGKRLFRFLRKHNPIYIQKSKDWIRDYRVGSKTGDYAIVKVETKKGKLKSLYGRKCIFMVTYNKGYKNGFLVLPLD
jgi:hypothetical protein